MTRARLFRTLQSSTLNTALTLHLKLSLYCWMFFLLHTLAIFKVCTQSTKRGSEIMAFSIFRVSDIFLKHHRMFSSNRNHK